MHIHHFACLDNRALLTGFLLGSAFAVERELQDSKRREIQQSEDNRHETTRRESGTTEPLKRNR